jgi:hypothetical protein
MSRLLFFIQKHDGNAMSGFHYPIRDHLILSYALYLPSCGRNAFIEYGSDREPMKSLKASIEAIMAKCEVYKGFFKADPHLDRESPRNSIAGEHGYHTREGYHIPFKSVSPFTEMVGKTFSASYDVEVRYFFVTLAEIEAKVMNG